ncbi:MAG: hypothetical protein M5R41_06830 [Bacteroidia bacterium]|nr:hypothetical protein [Bacteroidia bacterium]
MEFFEHEPEIIEHSNPHLKIRINSEDETIEQDVWKSYCYLSRKRKVVVCGRLLWPKYSANRKKVQRLDYLAKPEGDREIVRWINNNYIDPGLDIDIPDLGFEIYTKPDDYSNEIGFLFLCLKNEGKRNLFNYSVTFKVARLEANVPTFDDPGWRPFEKLREIFKQKGSPGDYLTTGQIEYGETEEFIIPTWEPGVSFLFLLSVYRSDHEGSENGYLDDVYILNTITRKTFLGTSSITVRQPSRERALREKVPYGWFRQ